MAKTKKNKTKKGSSLSKILLFPFFLLLVGVALFAGFSHLKAQSQPSITGAQTQSLTQTVSAYGDVEADNQTSLSFLTSGVVSQVNFKSGDHVKKGDLIAQLNNPDLIAALGTAQNNVRSTQSALDRIIDDIHNYQYGNGGFSNVGSANETYPQRQARMQAEAARDNALEAVKDAQNNLSHTQLVAPFDGKIVSIQNISQGANVSPTSGSSVLVAGGGDLKFVANVLEQDVPSVSIGQPVTIKLDSKKDQTFSGTVDKIAADKTVLPNGQTVIKVTIASSDLIALDQPGLTGTVYINIPTSSQTVVPSWTVLDSKYIWVTENGKIILKQVQVGETYGDKTQILSGLSSDDQVILDPQIIARRNYTFL